MKWIHPVILIFLVTNFTIPSRERRQLPGFTYPFEPDVNYYRTAFSKKEVPILCYHNIKTNVEGRSPDYTIKLDQFRAHIKMLSDSGYHTILPGELSEHLVIGATLPPKPIMITFDDTHLEHYTMAAPVLRHFGFRGVFFMMAVVIGKQGYMTTAQIKLLADSGHTIGGHTWDHRDLGKIDRTEWDYQISKPKHQLEQITGKPVLYFAYPYGAWSDGAMVELKKRGIIAAFQLSKKQSEKEPMYTIRRLMVVGNWTPDALYKKIESSFH
ncbi:MAG: polysaccharide deacetylase family protein [Flavitalea sp.]